jgi:hypothetical protein
LFRAGDFFENFARGLGPDEGLEVGIAIVQAGVKALAGSHYRYFSRREKRQVLHDGALEFGDAFKGPAADAVSGDLGKEALHHVRPGSRGRL